MLNFKFSITLACLYSFCVVAQVDNESLRDGNENIVVVTEARKAKEIEKIFIYGHRESLIGESISASSGSIGEGDIKQRATLRAGEVLEFVPGMVVTQHSGSGKANQYFLRGFNLDHGTDFSTTIDGLPINQRTHGHGQGYTDLNFIIPEFIKRIDYQKGPYHAEDGDFSTAGSAKFKLIDQLKSPFISLEVGENSFLRTVYGDSYSTEKGNLLVGFESQEYDGPWVNIAENVNKLNGLLKYSQVTNGTRLAVTFLGYDNSWNSADQIPLRAIKDNQIDRLATIDTTVGGESSRYSLSFDWSNDVFESNAYIIQSKLDLFSNFTYFLNDPDKGDQFEQVDERVTYGGSFTYHSDREIAGKLLNIQSGMQLRVDNIGEVGLYQTQKRERLSTTRNDSVEEYSVGLFWEGEVDLSDDLTTSFAIRYDYFGADVDSNTLANSGHTNEGLVNFKGGLSYTYNDYLEFYFNGGQSFHSNDARGTTVSVDPVDLLVRGEGAETGLRLQDGESYNISLALWVLELDSELIFVGDEGTTEPSRASRRAGVELSAYYWLNTKFSADLELAWTRSRFVDYVEGEGDRVDNSLPFVMSAGINYQPIENWNVNLRLRHFGKRILDSFGEYRGDRFTVLNLGLNYQCKRWQFGVEVLNLLDNEERDIEYFFASRLPNEPEEGIADIHLHPIQPRAIRFKLHYAF